MTATAVRPDGPAPAATGAVPVLAAEEVSVRFGGLAALRDVSLVVPRRSIVGLIGPNGAGKSTLVSVLSGLLTPQAGRVFIDGADVTAQPAHRRARRGLARTFQQPELFAGMTVREHLAVAWRSHFDRRRFWRDFVDGGAWRRPPKAESQRIDRLVEQLDLGHLVDAAVAALPLGYSRLVEIGRALAASPKVVLLDEPLSGLDADETERLAVTIRSLVESEGVSFLLIDHDVDTVLSRSTSVVALDFGQVITTGTAAQVRSHPQVRASYLGDAVGVEDPDGAPAAADAGEGS